MNFMYTEYKQFKKDIQNSSKIIKTLILFNLYNKINY